MMHGHQVPLRLEPAPLHRHAIEIAGLFIHDSRTQVWAEAGGIMAAPETIRYVPISEMGALLFVMNESEIALPRNQNAGTQQGVHAQQTQAIRSLNTAYAQLRSQYRVYPYQLLGGRLFLPADAMLYPALSNHELLNLFQLDLFLWHPQAGLVGYDNSAICRLIDLFATPSDSLERFDAAPTETYHSPGLRLIELMVPPSLTFLDTPGTEGVSDDIGDKQLDKIKLPGDNALSQTVRKVTGMGLNATSFGLSALNRLFSRPGRNSDAAAQSGSMENESGSTSQQEGSGALGWIAKGMAGLTGMAAGAINQLQRNQEIDRLLQMLQSNPDEGLRHAIPMGGDAGGNMSRGSGFGSNFLSRGLMNFSLSGISGGGPVDHWDIEWEKQQKLREHYRELAVAAAEAGRHRRAAYIYAHLLGDLRAAAGALEAGNMHREAAVIYKKKLYQPEQAARCLAAGGYFAEAVHEYQQLELWLKAAEVLEQAGRDDEARQMIRKEVQVLIERPDLLAAAALLEQRLDAVDEAVQLLENGWHESNQVNYLKAGIELHQKYHMQPRTIQLLSRISDQLSLPVTSLSVPHAQAESKPDRLNLRTPQMLQLVELYTELAKRHSDSMVRSHTRTMAYRICGSRLSDIPQYERGQLLQNLIRLSPNDTLLKRDVREQLIPDKRNTGKEVRTIGDSQSRLTDDLLTLTPCLHFDCEDQITLKTVGRAAVVLYRQHDHHDQHGQLVLYHIHFKRAADDIHALQTQWSIASSHLPDAILGDNENDNVMLYGSDLTGIHAVNMRAKERGNLWVRPAIGFGDLSHVCSDMPGELWAIKDDSLAMLDMNGSQKGSLVFPWHVVLNQDIEDSLEPDGAAIMHDSRLHVRRDRIVFGCMKTLWRYKRSTQAVNSDETVYGDVLWERIGELPATMQTLAAVSRFARPRYALGYEHGVTMVWDNLMEHHQQHIAGDLHSPKICFTHHSGLLVVADDHELRLFATSKGEANLIHKMTMPKGSADIVEVAPIGFGDHFLILTSEGELIFAETANPKGKTY